MLDIYEFPNEGKILQGDEVLLRSYVEHLITSYVPCDTGDVLFKEIAKDYGGSGTTCGFLCHWLMWRIGCRYKKTVNRDEPGDGLRYEVGKNISKIYSGGYFVGFRPGVEPKYGDIVLTSNGPPETEHVFVFMSSSVKDGKVCWNSADAGQRNDKGQQCARFRTRPFTGRELVTSAGLRKIQGWIPIDSLPLTAPATLF